MRTITLLFALAVALSPLRAAGQPAQRAAPARLKADLLVDQARKDAAAGDAAKAAEALNRAAEGYRRSGDASRRLRTLTELGRVQLESGDAARALETARRAAEASRAAPASRAEAAALNVLAGAQARMGRRDEALQTYRAAAEVGRRDRDGREEARAFQAVGALELAAGARDRARDALVKAVPRQQAFGEPDARAESVRTLGEAILQRSPRFATYLAKQALLAREASRGAPLAGVALARESRERHVEQRRLVDRLLAQGRFGEAQRMIGRVKASELDAVLPGEAPLARMAMPMTAKEAEAKAAWDALSDALVAKGERARELREKEALTAAEQAELARLEVDLADGIRAFEALLQRLEGELSASATAIEADVALKGTLDRLGPGNVAVFTYVGDDVVLAVLVTRDVEKGYLAKLPAAALREKVLALRRQLRDGASDPRALAGEVYDALLGEMTPDLAAAGATTIYWSLDRWLRYVPMPALRHDGRWLAESYRHVVVTDAATSRLERVPEASWTALGLGSSEGLPAVPEELAKVVRENDGEPGLLPGRRVLDPQFTRQAFNDELRRPPRVVHVATHYVFKPVLTRLDEKFASFLLLGDGNALTLRDVRDLAGATFQNVDLLTLSACNTATEIPPDADPALVGAEVDSLATVAQLKGASAVIATLWEVPDRSTPALVSQFYRRKTRDGRSKAEALHDAQVALITGCLGPGTAAPGECPPPSSSERKTGTSFWSFLSGCRPGPPGPTAAAPGKRGGQQIGAEPPPGARFPGWSHPFYWAPFILLGNGR